MSAILWSRRFLSGYQKAPKTPQNLPSKSKLIKAPRFQMGFEKPESGILEVETGRIVAGKKEIKIIESDEETCSYIILSYFHQYKWTKNR